MRQALLFLLPILLLSVSCGEKDPPVVQETPAVKLELEEAQTYGAVLRLKTLNTEKAFFLCSTTAVSADEAVSRGAEASGEKIVLTDLEPATAYMVTAVGIGKDGIRSAPSSVQFRTLDGPSNLYSWEKGREIPYLADMTLIPGPSSHRTPLEWSKERWGKHVSYTDEQGQEHWFFDAFLLIEGQQNDRYGDPGYTYVLTSEYKRSAPKTYWQQLLEFWFDGGSFLQQECVWSDALNGQIYSSGRSYSGKTDEIRFTDGQLAALDACVGETAGRIGPPPTKRYVIVAMPEPIYFDNYAASFDEGSQIARSDANSVYWGEIDGVRMDFSRTDHMIAAYRWFIDSVREKFREKQYRNIELLGFYILPEVLDTKWRGAYKKYDTVLPAVAEYLHSCNEALYWIPYNMAEGYKVWQDFGIDIAYMQPNYYWDGNKKPLSDTFSAINRYGMGLELEFEYSMVEAVQGAASAQQYRARFNDYLTWARSSGVYGKHSIALYSGTDALQQLADSPLEGDREMYHKLGHFIIESPLKK